MAGEKPETLENSHPWIRFALITIGLSWILAFIFSWIIYGIRVFILDSKGTFTSASGAHYALPSIPFGYLYYTLFGADLTPRSYVFQILLIIFIVYYIFQIFKLKSTKEKEDEELIIDKNLFDPTQIVQEFLITLKLLKNALSWKNLGIVLLLLGFFEIAWLNNWTLNFLPSLAPLIAAAIIIIVLIVLGPKIVKWIFGLGGIAILAFAIVILARQFGVDILGGLTSKLFSFIQNLATQTINFVFAFTEENAIAPSFLTFKLSETVIFGRLFSFLGGASDYLAVSVKLVLGFLFLFLHQWFSDRVTAPIKDFLDMLTGKYIELTKKFTFLPKIKKVETNKEILTKWDQPKHSNDIEYLLALISKEKDDVARQRYVNILVENIKNYSIESKKKDLFEKLRERHSYLEKYEEEFEKALHAAIKGAIKESEKKKKK